MYRFIIVQLDRNQEKCQMDRIPQYLSKAGQRICIVHIFICSVFDNMQHQPASHKQQETRQLQNISQERSKYKDAVLAQQAKSMTRRHVKLTIFILAQCLVHRWLNLLLQLQHVQKRHRHQQMSLATDADIYPRNASFPSRSHRMRPSH